VPLSWLISCFCLLLLCELPALFVHEIACDHCCVNCSNLFGWLNSVHGVIWMLVLPLALYSCVSVSFVFMLILLPLFLLPWWVYLVYFALIVLWESLVSFKFECSCYQSHLPDLPCTVCVLIWFFALTVLCQCNCSHDLSCTVHIIPGLTLLSYMSVLSLFVLILYATITVKRVYLSKSCGCFHDCVCPLLAVVWVEN